MRNSPATSCSWYFHLCFSGTSRFSSKWMPIYAYVDAHTCVNWMPSCLAWMLMWRLCYLLIVQHLFIYCIQFISGIICMPFGLIYHYLVVSLFCLWFSILIWLDTSCFRFSGVLQYESLLIPLEELRVDDKLNFVEEPIEIMDREVKKLRQSRIPIVKVKWNSKRGPEFTWEREDQMKQKYPQLFQSS